MACSPSAVSAPGKVLLAGGYLVLDPKYSGLVYALSARIHALSSVKASGAPNTITVRSPQFSEAEWAYSISSDSDSGTSVKQSNGSSNNKFVETTLAYVLSYLSPLPDSLPSITITIFADNSYYSQPRSEQALPRFNALSVAISSAHKTGLGSSAALVTALTACLVISFSPVPVQFSDRRALQRIHNLAQAAHCAAQGKVGSGFDVAAATFGSCIYHRFSPAILQAVGEIGTTGFVAALQRTVDRTWDLKVTKTTVPKGLRVVMGDVDCGSSTPGMVKNVLAWRTANPEAADKMWGKLEGLNTGLINMMELLAKRPQNEYSSALGQIAAGEAATCESGTLLQKIGAQIREIRCAIREMGKAAGVEIEPEEQTKLLDDATEHIDGVLGGVVPGAGGFDAVSFVAVDQEAVIEKLKRVLGDKVTILDADEEEEGVKQEPLSTYSSLEP